MLFNKDWRNRFSCNNILHNEFVHSSCCHHIAVALAVYESNIIIVWLSFYVNVCHSCAHLGLIEKRPCSVLYLRATAFLTTITRVRLPQGHACFIGFCSFIVSLREFHELLVKGIQSSIKAEIAPSFTLQLPHCVHLAKK